MTAYLIIYVLAAIGSIFQLSNYKKFSNFMYLIIFFYLLVFIGFRYEIGGDWIPYLHNYDDVHKRGIDSIKSLAPIKEPGFLIINLISTNYFFLNFISALIFLIGLFHFINNFHDKFLSIIISIPFFIILLGMGFQKQSASLGLMLLAYSYYLKDRNFYFVLYTFIATLFHFAALYLFIFVIWNLVLFNKKTSLILFFLFIVCTTITIILAYDQMTRISFENYLHSEDRKVSRGALPRLIVQYISILFFLFFIRFWDNYPKKKLIIIFNLFLTISITPFIFHFSNVVDRMVLFFMILQIMIYGDFGKFINNKYNVYFKFFVFFLYFSITLLWFNFSYFAMYWAPYKNIIYSG